MKLGHLIVVVGAAWCFWNWQGAVSAFLTAAGVVVSLVMVPLVNGFATYGSLSHAFPAAEFRQTRRSQGIGLAQFVTVLLAIAAILWFSPLYFSWVGLVLGIIPGCMMSAGQDRAFNQALAERLAILQSCPRPNTIPRRPVNAEVAVHLISLADEYPILFQVEEQILNSIAEAGDVVQSWLDDGKITPRTVAIQFAANTAGDLLESGIYHIYRGILTESGKRLLEFYTTCWRDNLVGGDWSSEKAADEIATMHEIVKNRG